MQLNQQPSALDPQPSTTPACPLCGQQLAGQPAIEVASTFAVSLGDGTSAMQTMTVCELHLPPRWLLARLPQPVVLAAIQSLWTVRECNLRHAAGVAQIDQRRPTTRTSIQVSGVGCQVSESDTRNLTPDTLFIRAWRLAQFWNFGAACKKRTRRVVALLFPTLGLSRKEPPMW